MDASMAKVVDSFRGDTRDVSKASSALHVTQQSRDGQAANKNHDYVTHGVNAIRDKLPEVLQIVDGTIARDVNSDDEDDGLLAPGQLSDADNDNAASACLANHVVVRVGAACNPWEIPCMVNNGSLADFIAAAMVVGADLGHTSVRQLVSNTFYTFMAALADSEDDLPSDEIAQLAAAQLVGQLCGLMDSLEDKTHPGDANYDEDLATAHYDLFSFIAQLGELHVVVATIYNPATGDLEPQTPSGWPLTRTPLYHPVPFLSHQGHFSVLTNPRVSDRAVRARDGPMVANMPVFGPLVSTVYGQYLEAAVNGGHATYAMASLVQYTPATRSDADANARSACYALRDVVFNAIRAHASVETIEKITDIYNWPGGPPAGMFAHDGIALGASPIVFVYRSGALTDIAARKQCCTKTAPSLSVVIGSLSGALTLTGTLGGALLEYSAKCNETIRRVMSASSPDDAKSYTEALKTAYAQWSIVNQPVAQAPGGGAGPTPLPALAQQGAPVPQLAQPLVPAPLQAAAQAGVQLDAEDTPDLTGAASLFVALRCVCAILTSGCLSPNTRRVVLPRPFASMKKLVKKINPVMVEAYHLFALGVAECVKTGHRHSDSYATAVRVFNHLRAALNGRCPVAMTTELLAFVSYSGTKHMSFRGTMLGVMSLHCADRIPGNAALTIAGVPAGSAAAHDAKFILRLVRDTSPLLQCAGVIYGVDFDELIDAIEGALPSPEERLKQSTWGKYMFGSQAKAVFKLVGLALEAVRAAAVVKSYIVGNYSGAVSLDKHISDGISRYGPAVDLVSKADTAMIAQLLATVSKMTGESGAAQRVAQRMQDGMFGQIESRFLSKGRNAVGVPVGQVARQMAPPGVGLLGGPQQQAPMAAAGQPSRQPFAQQPNLYDPQSMAMPAPQATQPPGYFPQPQGYVVSGPQAGFQGPVMGGYPYAPYMQGPR